jgi:hypothetical protein
MTYYPTIEEDLARAKEILDRSARDITTFANTGGETLYSNDIYAAYKLLESFVDEIERLHVERTRDALHYTFKGYQAGENTDAKHWRQRAEAAEAEIERLRSQATAAFTSAITEVFKRGVTE